MPGWCGISRAFKLGLVKATTSLVKEPRRNLLALARPLLFVSRLVVRRRCRRVSLAVELRLLSSGTVTLVAVNLGRRLVLTTHVCGPHSTFGLQGSFSSDIQGAFGCDLLLPHGVVNTLGSEKVEVVSLLNNGTGMKDDDLVSVRNGGQSMPGRRERLC